MHVFISYPGSEEALAQEIARLLKENDISAWGMQIGERRDALRNALVFLVLMCPDYLADDNCIAELQEASRLNKFILALEIESIDAVYPNEMDTHYVIDGIHNAYEIAMEQLLQAIEHELQHHVLDETDDYSLDDETELDIYISDPNEIETQDVPKVSTRTSSAIHDEGSQTIPQVDPRLETVQRAVQVEMPDEAVEWVTIKSGTVKLLATNRLEDYVREASRDPYSSVKSFAISKHLITNAQFLQFCEDDGYLHQKYWSDLGWQLKEASKWTQPRSWEDTTLKRFARADHPVVTISLYEALAYTLWLSEKLGATVRLPCDDQWQLAAEGESKHPYPWGAEWDSACCNHSYGQTSRGTSPVGQFKKGANEYGLYDLIGNVSEWCRTDFKTGNFPDDIPDALCIIRGGAWLTSDPEALTVTARDYCPADKRHPMVGFRIVMAIS